METIPGFAPTAPASSGTSWWMYLLVILVLGFIAQYIYSGKLFKQVPSAMSNSLVDTPLDGKQFNTVSGANIPSGVLDQGIQFWCQIRDWDYKQGQKKVILRRVDPTQAGVQAPEISLSPNENTLNVSVAIHPGDSTAAASEPAPSNAGGSATGDVFTCSVENVPLQTWVPISVTVFQRNLDIYLNGKLVKSCVLPGVPKTAAGDIEIGPDGGFSGTICDVQSQARMLNPADAQAFASAGSPCQSLGGNAAGGGVGLFGQSVKFGVYDPASGKPVKEYAF